MQTVLISGADRGLGLCLAAGFARDGWRVFAGRFNDDYGLADKLAEEYPAVVTPVKMDVSRREDILAAYAGISAMTDHLDMVISNAAYMGGTDTATLKGSNPIDYALLEYSMGVNAFGAIQLMEIFLPLLDRGAGKRICFISSEVSSVGLMRRDGGFRYTMTKTAVNLACRMLYNQLFSQGYTFRLYQPGWMKRMLPDGTLAEGGALDPAFSAEEAIRQFTADRPDEQRLVLTDYMAREWTF
ncbi:MAG: SDR family NAD(P)-dependent oxidoreductase [Christensenellales bacterium]|jgi:NAD(P)-dependent dehydrogenase (short-subunit alcohol dehydrogenase family)